MPRVRVFSTPICPYCVTLKEFLKSHQIEFEEIDVSQDMEAQKEMVEKTDQMGLPVIAIDEEFIIGFDRQRIEELLNLENK